jgi:hypothetical protein
MNNSKDLNKLIDILKNKIKNLDNIRPKQLLKKTNNNQINNNQIYSYRVFNPKNNVTNKKYIALLFDNNSNDFETDSSNNIKNLIPFIKLSKGNLIINYSIIIEISEKINKYCSIAIGIKSINEQNSKIKIIKGSKYAFNPSDEVIENKIQINNTLLYACSEEEELCIISEFYNTCSVNYKKSLIKILNL